MRCASVTSKENNVRATGYIYSTELPFPFFVLFSLARKLQDGWFPPCLVQTLCPSCGLSSLPTHPHPFSPFNEDPLRLIGCQPIKAQRFRNPPKKEKGHPRRSSLHHTCSHIIAIFIYFSFFLLAVLVSLVSYAVPCCIGRAYLPTLICFCLHDNLPGFLYGVLSCNKYQSWVEAPP
jgi:hypothetical protein